VAAQLSASHEGLSSLSKYTAGLGVTLYSFILEVLDSNLSLDTQ
jgi:hypothetical protein